MKAHIESSPRNLRELAKIAGEGKVQKAKLQNKSAKDNMESEGVKEYLQKLQTIVPNLPNDKRLSKLEVITNVIEYIRELRLTLGLPPSCNGEDYGFDRESMMMMTQDDDEEEEDTTTVTLTVINSNNDEKCSKVDSRDSSLSYQSSGTRQPLGVISSTANNSSRIPREVSDKTIYTNNSS